MSRPPHKRPDFLDLVIVAILFLAVAVVGTVVVLSKMYDDRLEQMHHPKP